MRRAIVVQGDHRFMSAMVGKDTAEVLKVGDMVKVTRDLELDFCGRVKAGERAKIIFTDPPSGAVEMEFMRVLPNLHEWRNCLLVTPYDSDDLLQGLALDTAFEAKESASAAPLYAPARFVPHLIAATLLAFIVGWLVPGPFDTHVHAHYSDDLSTACKG